MADIRLNKIIRKYNIGLQDLVDFLNKQGAETTLEQRRMLATRAFGVSSHYDTAIHAWFEK